MKCTVLTGSAGPPDPEAFGGSPGMTVLVSSLPTRAARQDGRTTARAPSSSPERELYPRRQEPCGLLGVHGSRWRVTHPSTRYTHASRPSPRAPTGALRGATALSQVHLPRQKPRAGDHTQEVSHPGGAACRWPSVFAYNLHVLTGPGPPLRRALPS